MTTPNLPGPERVDTYKVFLRSLPLCRLPPNQASEARFIINEIFSILDALPALQAENERLRKEEGENR